MVCKIHCSEHQLCRNQSLKLQGCTYMWGEEAQTTKKVYQEWGPLEKKLASNWRVTTGIMYWFICMKWQMNLDSSIFSYRYMAKKNNDWNIYHRTCIYHLISSLALNLWRASSNTRRTSNSFEKKRATADVLKQMIVYMYPVEERGWLGVILLVR